MVKVYFNLHKKLFSVVEKGLVVAHVDRIMLKDVRFKVSEAGRQRVLRERKKNVHAFVCGEIVDYLPHIFESVGVRYNPYDGPKFTRVDNHAELETANFAELIVENKRPRIRAIVVQWACQHPESALSDHAPTGEWFCNNCGKYESDIMQQHWKKG